MFNLKLPPKNPKKVTGKIVIFLCTIKPLSETKIETSLINLTSVNINLVIVIRLKFKVPDWIINYGSRLFANNFFNKIVEKAKNFKGSSHEKKI